MKAKHGRRAGVYRRSKGKISRSTFAFVTKCIILLLCVYIVSRSTSIILGEEKKRAVADFGKKMVRKTIEVIVTGKNNVEEWIIENKDLGKKRFGEELDSAVSGGSVGEVIKKEMAKSRVDEFLVKASESGNTEEKQLVENMKAENAAVLESTSSTEEDNAGGSEESTGDTIEENATEMAEEVFALKTIVPKPKLTGTKYTLKKLKGFENTIKKFYTVTSATSIKASDLNVEKALNAEFKITGDNSKPQILIYHTHSQEDFKDTGSNKNKTIVQVGDYLAEILREQFGYNVLHDTSTYDLVNGELDRNKAYEQSRAGVSKILKDNPSINLVLDLHRDGMDEDVHLVTEVNGKQTATIMFFNGMSRLKDLGDIDYLYNPYLKENLALSLQMKLNAEAYYPGFTRKNYINAYQYNLDLCEKAMLIEMGAQTNTFEEVKNAAEPLAMLLYLTMGDAQK